MLKRHNNIKQAFRFRVPCGLRKRSENGTRGRNFLGGMEKKNCLQTKTDIRVDMSQVLIMF